MALGKLAAIGRPAKVIIIDEGNCSISLSVSNMLKMGIVSLVRLSLNRL